LCRLDTTTSLRFVIYVSDEFYLIGRGSFVINYVGPTRG